MEESNSKDFFSDEVKEELLHLPAVEWTAEDEIALFQAISERPFGNVIENWKMAHITELFHNFCGKRILVDTIAEKLETMYSLDLLEKDETPKECQWNNDNPQDFSLEQSVIDDVKSVEIPILKDYTRQKTKKEGTPPPPVASSKTTPIAESESDEEDMPLKPAKPGRRSKVQTPASSKRDTPKRGTRGGVKDALPANAKKTDEDSKKERGSLKGRSLRSRGDDESSSPAPTPPPSRRPRRI